ncbi:MAG: hypothetical protein IJN39_07665 [Clostridia bacterium]|nr:hypothetical protein [Clostridia bacterium]
MKKQLITLFLVLTLIISLIVPVNAAQTEYVVKYNDSAVTYTGNWTASSQYSDPNTASSKMTSNSAGTATFPLPSGAPAGEYEIYYFLAHTTTSGMTVSVNGQNTHFSATIYTYPSASVVKEYVQLGGNTTYTLKGDGTDSVVLTAGSSGYSRATSIKFVYVGPAREKHTVRYDSSDVTYKGTWTSSGQYSDENTASSKMSTEAGATATFSLPENATAGSYAVYYFLTHTTSGYSASIKNETYSLAPSSYGYTTSAVTIRQWVRIGGTYNLDPGDSITFTRSGYTRATSVKFVRLGDKVVPDTNYLTLKFDSSDEISNITYTNGSMSVSDGSMTYTHIGSVQDNIFFPTLKNTPADGDVVLDFTFKINSMKQKMTFLVRAGETNNLFMHSEITVSGDKINLVYYDGSSTGTTSGSGYSFELNRKYRFVVIFHTETAKYDIKIFDLENQYTVENISGISPKSSAVTTGTEIKSFEMQNHNTGGTSETVSSWTMDEILMYDISYLTLPEFPAPPVVKDSYLRIPVDGSGFTKSAGWTSASMPDSIGAAKSLYTSTAGEYAKYTPENLEPGWYKISFWNIKYDTNQNPMKMTASVYSDGRLRTLLPLPVNTVSENRGGIWSEIGTFYFDGDNTEYVSLIASGGNFARVADVKFELQENYTPDYKIITDGLSVNLESSMKFDSMGGVYKLYADGITNGILRIFNGKTEIAYKTILADGTKSYIGTFLLPENQFIYINVNGNINNGKLYFEEATNEKYALVSLSDNLMSNEPVRHLSAGDFKVTANINNPDKKDVTAILIAVVYEKSDDESGDKLITKSLSEQVNLSNGKAELSCDITVLNVTENSYLKVMVWDSLTGMHPLTKPEVYLPYTPTSPYLLLAEDANTIGSWSLSSPNDNTAFSDNVLTGLSSSGTTSPATFNINCKEPGEYRLWVRSKNFALTPGLRYFNVSVNGTEVANRFGVTAKDGYLWEDGGTVTLVNGNNTISVSDTSCYYARLDALLLSKDTEYIPSEDYSTLTQTANKALNLPMSFTEADLMKEFVIDESFSGGNVLVDGMKQNTIYIRPDLSDTSADWFYWNFKATSDIDRTVTFIIDGKYIISASGVAYSYDGENWDYISESAYKDRFTFDLEAGKTVQFSCTIPYVLSDLEAFIEKCETDYSDKITVSALCKSEQGRDVPLFTIGNTESNKNIVLTSRHHCCEATPSFLIEGLIAYLAASCSEDILNEYCFYIVPMIDVDGVENGDQGKQRIPHDHNRDYDERIYNSIDALIKFTDNLNIVAFMDFHCPGLQTPEPYFYYSSAADESELDVFRTKLFAAIEQDTDEDKILYLGETDYDDSYFTACSRGYFRLEKNAPLSTTLEFPYTGRVGDEYTKDRMINFGKNVGHAFELYLETLN